LIGTLATSEKDFWRYIDRGRPCLGPVRNHPKVNKCNHFDLVENIMTLYPQPATKSVLKLSNGLHDKSARLLRKFPFDRAFSGVRKALILKILDVRAERLRGILPKGGAQ
jgi:hypothetical protein